MVKPRVFLAEVEPPGAKCLQQHGEKLLLLKRRDGRDSGVVITVRWQKRTIVDQVPLLGRRLVLQRRGGGQKPKQAGKRRSKHRPLETAIKNRRLIGRQGAEFVSQSQPDKTKPRVYVVPEMVCVPTPTIFLPAESELTL